jgi:hypothetical protein
VADAPDPLVAAEVDLRDFAYLPLDVLRLRDSDLACVEDAEVFRCAVLSWCVSWHQVPAASLPDDDALLSRLLGFGRDVKAWKRVRAAGGLRGWILCSDGRLYHDVVAEKARDAWAAKLAQRARTEAARKAREEARQRQSQSLSQTVAASVTDNVTGTVTESKGEGREGNRKEKNMVAAAATTAPPLRPRDLEAEGVSPQAAADWIALRKAKRLPLTPTAWTDTKAEGEKAGLSPSETVERAVANNWAGFKASWLKAADKEAANSDPYGLRSAL